MHGKSVVEFEERRVAIQCYSPANSLTQELKMRCLFISLFVFSLAATTPAAQKPTSRPLSPTAQASIWEQELRDADLDFAKQTAARRLEGWMDFFADDGSIIHDGQTVTGKAALRAFYTPLFENKDFNLTWSPTHAEASQDGTLGYTYGEYHVKNGTAIGHGMYTTMWRKIGGRWKVILDLGSAARSQSKPQN
jgi:ketosteroid isomerase-like protein